ncbi:hypothetical protein [Actinoplanes xinjiangensis]|uniref:Uncharacterized protein n=1 Tax=Actinoplanes xinjiangensis TaxID=512350 RepID=A0A316FCR6_9ACTN|nr:hypothetical protein [Actinoplanes xinjiangensis]PWK45266.1 hypothetical protein BC793_111240 [Actinoplanes xinjiangensis]GIF41400.1 hypothetical protein Axi01nite_57110 [Actinoplanes xinjiangensis]
MPQQRDQHFPRFIAIERIVNADLRTTSSLTIIAGYALVYSLPFLLLLIATRDDRVRRRLGNLYERLGAKKKQPAACPSRPATSSQRPAYSPSPSLPEPTTAPDQAPPAPVRPAR